MGYKRTPEQRRRMSEAQKLRHAKRGVENLNGEKIGVADAVIATKTAKRLVDLADRDAAHQWIDAV